MVAQLDIFSNKKDLTKSLPFHVVCVTGFNINNFINDLTRLLPCVFSPVMLCY